MTKKTEPKRGRPKAEDPLLPKTIRLQKSRIPVYEAAASDSGMDWSEWVRAALDAFCRRRPKS